jgi:hypothetical protein
MEPTFGTSTSPLNPMSSITSPLSPFIATLDVKHVLALVFGLIFFVWLIYTLVVLYHWIRYGHRSTFAIPSFILHIVVSGALLLMALSAC